MTASLSFIKRCLALQEENIPTAVILKYKLFSFWLWWDFTCWVLNARVQQGFFSRTIGPCLPQFWTKEWNNFSPFTCIHCNCEFSGGHWQVPQFVLVTFLSGCSSFFFSTPMKWHFTITCVIGGAGLTFVLFFNSITAVISVHCLCHSGAGLCLFVPDLPHHSPVTSVHHQSINLYIYKGSVSDPLDFVRQQPHLDSVRQQPHVDTIRQQSPLN